MKKQLNTLGLIFGLLAMLGVGTALAKGASAEASGKFRMPYDSSRNLAPLEYSGVQSSTQSASGSVASNNYEGLDYAYTAQRKFFEGTGVFYGIQASTGTAGAPVWCYDSSSAETDRGDMQQSTSTILGSVRRAAATDTATPQSAPPIRIRKGMYCDSTVDAFYLVWFSQD